jgi:hypothetical protein
VDDARAAQHNQLWLKCLQHLLARATIVVVHLCARDVPSRDELGQSGGPRLACDSVQKFTPFQVRQRRHLLYNQTGREALFQEDAEHLAAVGMLV